MGDVPQCVKNTRRQICTIMQIYVRCAYIFKLNISHKEKVIKQGLHPDREQTENIKDIAQIIVHLSVFFRLFQAFEVFINRLLETANLKLTEERM